MAQPKSPMSYTTEHVSTNQSEHLNTPGTDCCTSSRSSLYSKMAALSTDLDRWRVVRAETWRRCHPLPIPWQHRTVPCKTTNRLKLQKWQWLKKRSSGSGGGSHHKQRKSDSKLQLYHFYFILLPEGNFLPSANLHQPQKVQVFTPLQTCDLFYSQIFTMFMQLVKCKFICARSLPWQCSILCLYFVCDSEM